eukprot:2886117-Amphidinium_carterae.2
MCILLHEAPSSTAEPSREGNTPMAGRMPVVARTALSRMVKGQRASGERHHSCELGEGEKRNEEESPVGRDCGVTRSTRKRPCASPNTVAAALEQKRRGKAKRLEVHSSLLPPVLPLLSV